MADLRKARAATEDKGFQRMMAKITGFFNPGPATPPESVPVATQTPHRTPPDIGGITPPPTRVFKKDPDMSRPPPPPPRKRRGGGDDGDGSGGSNQPIQPNPNQGKEIMTATTSDVPAGTYDRQLVSAIIIAVLAAVAAALAYAAFAYNDNEKRKFHNSDAGLALIAIKARKVEVEAIEAEKERILATNGRALPPAAQSQPQPTTTAPTSVASPSGEVRSMTISPCDGKNLAVNAVAPGQIYEAAGGASGGCLAVRLAERMRFWGVNYELRAAGNFEDRVTDMSVDGGPQATQSWLDSHVGQDIVVILFNESWRFGQVRFN